jgi:hypothetical protein
MNMHCKNRNSLYWHRYITSAAECLIVNIWLKLMSDKFHGFSFDEIIVPYSELFNEILFGTDCSLHMRYCLNDSLH